MQKNSALFTPEQLTEIYRAIHGTLWSRCPITNERQQLLAEAARQIEHSIPDLEERVSRSQRQEFELQNSRMNLC